MFAALLARQHVFFRPPQQSNESKGLFGPGLAYLYDITRYHRYHVIDRPAIWVHCFDQWVKRNAKNPASI